MLEMADETQDQRVQGNRPSLVNGVTLELTKSDPLLRLNELCTQGKYRYKMSWDKFQNGIMITCKLFYLMNRNKYTVLRDALFVRTDKVIEAKRTISAVVLDRLDLGENEYTGDNESSESSQESSSSDITSEGLNMASELMGSVMEMVEGGGSATPVDLQDVLKSSMSKLGPILQKTFSELNQTSTEQDQTSE